MTTAIAPYTKPYEFQFYPTTPELVRKLITPYYSKDLKVLEPSAGRGDICDQLPFKGRTAGYRHGMDIHCCEISPDLRSILIQKGYKVIGTDFLKLTAPYLFDLVLMNPPFAHAPAHVIKAWEMVKPGGSLAAILPITVREREDGLFPELNQLIDLFGQIEEQGEAFSAAERRTGVAVMIVRLTKPAQERNKAFDNFNPKQDEEYQEPEERQLPVTRDLVAAIVAQYEASMRALRVRHESDQAFRHVAPSKVFQYEPQQYTYAEWIDRTKIAFWDLIFERTRIGEATTSGFRKEFMEKRAAMSLMDFSVETIWEVLDHFMQNRDDIFEQCVRDLFRQITKHSRDNVTKKDAFATNKGWKLTPKVILPNMNHGWDIDYREKDIFNDLDKVLQMFGSPHGVSTAAAMEEVLTKIKWHGAEYMGKHDTPNFEWRVYKKGTIHLYFKDLGILEAINRYMAEHEMPALGSGR